LDEFWHCFVRRWLDALIQSLPGRYAQAESKEFHLLSELDDQGRARTLQFLEQSCSHIQKVVGDTAEEEWHGKHLVLRFSDQDTYYRYLAHFSSDGEHAGSAGCFLKAEYYHIVYPASWSMDEERATLAHELTHNLLADLPLPRWLDEALAMAFQADVCGFGDEPVNRELSRRHREYWNEKTIQDFWLGTSFGTVKGQELSYSLARVLLQLIHNEVRPEPDKFHRFVTASDWHDAGAIACREYLDVRISDLIGSFLGPKDWEPKPEAWESDAPPAQETPHDDVDEEEEVAPGRRAPICEVCGGRAYPSGKVLGRVIYRCDAGHES
jgi:hypothetical protein